MTPTVAVNIIADSLAVRASDRPPLPCREYQSGIPSIRTSALRCCAVTCPCRLTHQTHSRAPYVCFRLTIDAR